jgi:hypothetical protein
MDLDHGQPALAPDVDYGTPQEVVQKVTSLFDRREYWERPSAEFLERLTKDPQRR